MDLHRFVRITRDNSSTEGGTGYLIYGDRVLTARHVIEGAKSLKVHFDGEKGEVASERVSAVWEGTGDLDVAVLSVETPLRLKRQILAVTFCPDNDDVRWRSRGWAVACAVEPDPNARIVDSMSGLIGTVYQFSESAKQFEVGVDHPPSSADWWHGVSGAPIFCGWKLVGVIAHGERPFEGGRLRAIPVSALWGDDAFRESLGYGAGTDDYRDQRRKELLEDLEEIFESSPGGAAAIAAEEPRWQEAFQAEQGGGVKGLSESILVTPSWQSILEAFERATEKRLGKLPALHARDAEAIQAALLRVLPEIFWASEIETTASGEGGVLLSLPSANRTLVEISMAAIDGRALKFAELQGPKQSPRGSAAMGLEGRSKQKTFDFQQPLAFREFALRLADELGIDSSQIEACSKGNQEAELGKLVNHWIGKEVKKFGEPRRYFLYTREFGQNPLNAAFLSRVRERLPELSLVECPELETVDEIISVSSLQTLLFKSSQRKKGGS